MEKTYTLNFIDFQNDFVAPNGALTFDNKKGDPTLIAKTSAFFKILPPDVFSNAIVTYDTHFKETYPQSEEGKNFPIHCVKNSYGWQLAIDTSLIEKKINYIQYLQKSTYDMWEESIEKINPTILKKTNEVVLFGVASDICNKAALKGWIKKEIPVTILEDLTRGIYQQTWEVLNQPQFKEAVQKGKVKCMSSRAFLKKIQHERS